MAWLWSSTFLPYTVISATTEMPGYEAAKLPILDNHPYLHSWRSNNSLALHGLLFDVGAPIVDANFDLSVPPALSASWATVIGTPGGGDSAQSSVVQRRSLPNSFRLVCASGNIFGRAQTGIAVTPGATYRFTAWLNVTAFAAGTVTMSVSTPIATDLLVLTRSSVTGGFISMAGTFTVPDRITSVQVNFLGLNTPNFTAYLDDVSLVPNIGAIAIFNTNCPQLLFGHCETVGGSFTFLPTFTLNRWWNYYRGCFVQGTVIQREFIAVLTPTNDNINGAAYYEIGSIQFLPPLLHFGQAPARDMPETAVRPVVRSGNSVAVAGPWKTTQAWKMVVRPDKVDEMQRFALISQAMPFIVFENNGLSEECGIYRYVDDLVFTRSTIGRYQIVNVKTEELV